MFLGISWLFWILLLSVTVFVAGIGVGLVILLKPQQKEFPYSVTPGVLSYAEQGFYQSLLVAVDNRWHIFPKMRVEQLLKIHREGGEYQFFYNMIAPIMVDFVLVDSVQYAPVLIIEFIGTHEEKKAARTPPNEKKHAILKALDEQVGLPLLVIKADSMYDYKGLRKEIDALLLGTPKK